MFNTANKQPTIGHYQQLIHTHHILQNYFHSIFNIITRIYNLYSPQRASWRGQRQIFLFAFVPRSSELKFLCIPRFPRPGYDTNRTS
jgi:hypothetical protein